MATYDSLFKLIDTDHNGTLSIDEVVTFCEVLPNAPSHAVIARLFAQADVDKSGAIDDTEFSALCEGIKMLVNMTETEIVEAYATSEIRRLFTYLCTANGKTMRRDELRKTLEILVDALQITNGDFAVQNVLRENNEFEYDFDAFKDIVLKLCPGRALSNIATVFVEEETRRKEKLSKTRSMFEMKRGSGGAGERDHVLRRGRIGGNDESASASAGVPCQSCEALRAQLQTANEALAEADAIRIKLEEKEHESQQLAMREIEQQAAARRGAGRIAALEGENGELREQSAKATARLEEATKRLKEAEQRLAEAEGFRAAVSDRDAQLGRLEEESAQLREELQQVQARYVRRGEELEEATQVGADLRRKLKDKDAEVERLRELLGDMQLKEEESVRMERLMNEMRKRCDERDEEAARTMTRAEELAAKVAGRERELEAREDTVNEKYRALRRYEDELHQRWDGVIERARREQAEVADSLAVRELELVQREAEQKVKEQLTDANIRRAEQASLPERERRLKLLQQIERELCERERKLRQAEATYLRSVVDAELEELRQERDDLQQRLWATKAELKEHALRHRQEVERLVADHSRRLNAQLQARAVASPSVQRGKVRSSTITDIVRSFGSAAICEADRASVAAPDASSPPSLASPRFDL